MGTKNLQDVQPVELTVEHGIAMASSLQVAKHFEKDHNQVLRKIRSLLKNLPERNVCNFTPINISKDLGHAMRQNPAYLLNRDAFTLLAIEFTSKKALATGTRSHDR